jgi:hypothetical protein
MTGIPTEAGFEIWNERVAARAKQIIQEGSDMN